jgi:hypothetical protein
MSNCTVSFKVVDANGAVVSGASIDVRINSAYQLDRYD